MSPASILEVSTKTKPEYDTLRTAIAAGGINAMPITFGEQKQFTASDPLPRPNPAETMPHMTGERLATMRKNLDTTGCCRWHRAGP